MNLEHKISSLKQETNPILKGRSVRGDPKPLPVGKPVFVNRTIQLSTTGTELRLGAIITALGLYNGSQYVIPVDVKIDWIKVWNTTGRWVTLKITPDSLLLATAGPLVPYAWTDYAPLSRFPGIEVNIPFTLTNTLQGTGSSTLNICDVVKPDSADNVLFQIGLRYALNN